MLVQSQSAYFSLLKPLKGANINHTDIDKATPLHKAAFNGHLECVKILVKRGCDVNITDNEGISALQKVSNAILSSLTVEGDVQWTLQMFAFSDRTWSRYQFCR